MGERSSGTKLRCAATTPARPPFASPSRHPALPPRRTPTHPHSPHPQLVKEPYTWSVGGAVIDNGSQIISMLVPTLLRVLVLPVGLVCAVVWGVLNRAKVEAWMNGKSRQAAMKRK